MSCGLLADCLMPYELNYLMLIESNWEDGAWQWLGKGAGTPHNKGTFNSSLP